LANRAIGQLVEGGMVDSSISEPQSEIPNRQGLPVRGRTQTGAKNTMADGRMERNKRNF
jgi:hypothetical protein